jgi:hypothetical protein
MHRNVAKYRELHPAVDRRMYYRWLNNGNVLSALNAFKLYSVHNQPLHLQWDCMKAYDST